MPAIAHQNKILGNGALVDDTTTSADKTWSSSKINTELGLKANSADVPLKTQITNPNLLDNPWFTINQRGQSTYTASGYTADRWKISGGSLELNNNGATFTTNAQYVMLEQYLPSDIFEVGKEYTISYKKTDGTYYAKTFTYANSASWATIWDNSINGWYSTYRTTNGVVELVVLDSRGSSETSVSLRAIKLELGSISTLALDTAPNYATELLKCQRYFQRLCNVYGRTYAGVGTGIVANSTGCRLFVPINAEFRTTPSVTFNDDSGKIMIVGANTSQRIAVTNVQLNQIGKNCIILTLTTASSSDTFTAGQSVECWFMNTTSAYIDFTADL